MKNFTSPSPLSAQIEIEIVSASNRDSTSTIDRDSTSTSDRDSASTSDRGSASNRDSASASTWKLGIIKKFYIPITS